MQFVIPCCRGCGGLSEVVITKLCEDERYAKALLGMHLHLTPVFRNIDKANEVFNFHFSSSLYQLLTGHIESIVNEIHRHFLPFEDTYDNNQVWMLFFRKNNFKLYIECLDTLEYFVEKAVDFVKINNEHHTRTCIIDALIVIVNNIKAINSRVIEQNVRTVNKISLLEKKTDK
ncbi:hypothetical protein PAEPH01_2306 [Pancytospora epiphaga]|nr:hypothetical protein PAEPH01_2306 [Pancytospora epiphaga]